MAKVNYDDLLKEEEVLRRQLSDRVVQAGSLTSGVPVERDRDPKITTVLRERLKAIQEQKAEHKKALDPMERMVYDLYEDLLKRKEGQ